MSTADYAAVYAQAIAEAGAGSEVLPDGDYDLRIASVKPGQSKGAAKKEQIGIRLEVTTGPLAGKSTWVNQTFSPENPQAVAVFLRILQTLGVPSEAVAAGYPPAKLAEYIVVGSTGKGTLGHHDWNDKPYQDLKKFTLDSAAPAAVAAAPVVAVAAPVAPVAAPVVAVAAPVAVAPVVPVAAPVEAAPVAAPAVVPVAAPAPGAPPF